MRSIIPAWSAAAAFTVLALGACPAWGQETLFNPYGSLEDG